MDNQFITLKDLTDEEQAELFNGPDSRIGGKGRIYLDIPYRCKEHLGLKPNPLSPGYYCIECNEYISISFLAEKRITL